MSEMDQRRRPKKKKNSRFMRNAKGFAKQGIYGRGTHIEDDQYNYFINILDAMKKDFEDTEEKVNMANNVFDQTFDQEIHLASNQIVCKALENLISYVNEKHLETFFEKFADNLRPICSDRFASHVLQKMVGVAFLRSIAKDNQKLKKENDEDDATEEPSPLKKMKIESVLTEDQYNLQTTFSKEHRKNCAQFVLRISKFTLNNLEDFVWDNCANHIIRTCILCLAGIHIPKIAFDKGKADMIKSQTIYKVPEEWHEVMKEFPQRLEMWPQFPEFPYNEVSSALLGVICIALQLVDKNQMKHFGKKILLESFQQIEENSDDEQANEDANGDGEETEENTEEKMKTEDENDEKTESTEKISLPKVFLYQSSLMLLETILCVCGPKLFSLYYQTLFIGRIPILAKDSSSNFTIQKLLNRIKDKEDFEQVFTDLVGEIEELLRLGYTGVVTSISETCLRLATKQAQLVVALQQALHLGNDKEKAKAFFFCLVKLKPYEILQNDQSNFVHLHGSLIIQHLLQFNKPIQMVNNILETPPDQLIAVFNTPNGSHIVDAFLKSKYIGAKSRERFLQHLENFYIDLAITKFGSRVVDKCFEAAANNDKQQQRIVKELSDKSNMLKGSPFGRLLFNKLRIDTFRLSAAQWKAAMQHKPKNKADELLKDILNK